MQAGEREEKDCSRALGQRKKSPHSALMHFSRLDEVMAPACTARVSAASAQLQQCVCAELLLPGEAHDQRT
eukprot:s2620_g19.t1